MSSTGGEVIYVILRTFFLNEEEKESIEKKSAEHEVRHIEALNKLVKGAERQKRAKSGKEQGKEQEGRETKGEERGIAFYEFKIEADPSLWDKLLAEAKIEEGRLILMVRRMPFQPAREFSCTAICILRYRGYPSDPPRRMILLDWADRLLKFALERLSLTNVREALKRQEDWVWTILVCAIGIPEQKARRLAESVEGGRQLPPPEFILLKELPPGRSDMKLFWSPGRCLGLAWFRGSDAYNLYERYLLVALAFCQTFYEELWRLREFFNRKAREFTSIELVSELDYGPIPAVKETLSSVLRDLHGGMLAHHLAYDFYFAIRDNCGLSDLAESTEKVANLVDGTARTVAELRLQRRETESTEASLRLQSVSFAIERSLGGLALWLSTAFALTIAGALVFDLGITFGQLSIWLALAWGWLRPEHHLWPALAVWAGSFSDRLFSWAAFALIFWAGFFLPLNWLKNRRVRRAFRFTRLDRALGVGRSLIELLLGPGTGGSLILDVRELYGLAERSRAFSVLSDSTFYEVRIITLEVGGKNFLKAVDGFLREARGEGWEALVRRWRGLGKFLLTLRMEAFERTGDGRAMRGRGTPLFVSLEIPGASRPDGEDLMADLLAYLAISGALQGLPGAEEGFWAARTSIAEMLERPG